MEVQTRDIDGALRFFTTIKEAWAYANSNPKVWKVSWSDGDTHERLRFVRSGSGDWVYESLDSAIPRVSQRLREERDNSADAASHQSDGHNVFETRDEGVDFNEVGSGQRKPRW